jgi:hypothetical protein
LHKVSIEKDAHYRQCGCGLDFAELCTRCGEERSGREAECSCGQPFANKEKGFFKRHFTPPDLLITFPDRCPRTMGEVSRTLRFGSRRITSGQTQTKLWYEVPVSTRMRSPLIPYFAGLFLAFFAVVFGLMAAFSVLDAPARAVVFAGLFLACLVGFGWAVREYTWFRLAWFDHRRVVFKVRRLDYALELARLNRGRVLRP